MAAVDDLVAAVDTLKADRDALRASYDALKARVDAIIGAPPAEDPRIAAAAADVQAVADALDAQKGDQDAFHAS